MLCEVDAGQALPRACMHAPTHAGGSPRHACMPPRMLRVAWRARSVQVLAACGRPCMHAPAVLAWAHTHTPCPSSPPPFLPQQVHLPYTPKLQAPLSVAGNCSCHGGGVCPPAVVTWLDMRAMHAPTGPPAVSSSTPHVSTILYHGLLALRLFCWPAQCVPPAVPGQSAACSSCARRLGGAIWAFACAPCSVRGQQTAPKRRCALARWGLCVTPTNGPRGNFNPARWVRAQRPQAVPRPQVVPYAITVAVEEKLIQYLSVPRSHANRHASPSHIIRLALSARASQGPGGHQQACRCRPRTLVSPSCSVSPSLLCYVMLCPVSVLSPGSFLARGFARRMHFCRNGF